MHRNQQVSDQKYDTSVKTLSCLDAVAIRNPITTEMSKELVLSAPGASGTSPGAHNVAIKDSTFIDVQGSYVSGRFVTRDDMIVTDYMPEPLRGSQDREWISISTSSIETRGYG